MPEHDKGKEFLKGRYIGLPLPPPPIPASMMRLRPGIDDLAPLEETMERYNSVKDAEKRAEILSSASDFAEQRMDTTKDAEDSRFKKMQLLNGTTFENGERSQGDQEAEQRMVQNKKTGLLQKFVNMVTKPFNDAFEKEFGTEDQPKYGGKDAVMYKGKFIHPDLYKMLMNRPDLEQRFTETGSIFGE